LRAERALEVTLILYAKATGGTAPTVLKIKRKWKKQGKNRWPF